MRITRGIFGEMLRQPHWNEDRYFIPLGLKNNGRFIGENEEGKDINVCSTDDDWEFHPKSGWILASKEFPLKAGKYKVLLRTGQMATAKVSTDDWMEWRMNDGVWYCSRFNTITHWQPV